VNDGRLALLIKHSDGSTTRWGGDEPDSINVPVGLAFGTAMPGLFKDCTITLQRRIDIDYPDINLFDDVTVYGAGGRIAWEGRVVQAPRSHGDGYSIQIGCVGWSAHLRDDSSFREIYVDRDPGGWQAPPLNRRLGIIGSNRVLDNDYTAKTDQGSIGFDGAAGRSIPSGSETELFYIAPSGVTISKVQYKGTEANTTNVEAATLYGAAVDDLTGNITTSLTLDDTVRTATLSAAKRYLMLRALASATHTPAAGSPFSRTFKKIAEYGNHGLTLRTTQSGEPDGVYASDVIADVLSRAAPLLNYTTGTDGSIEPTSFAIPQLSFRDMVTPEEVILACNAFHLFEWGVGENKQFFFRGTDPARLTWEARLEDGAHLDLEGPQADTLYNGVVVNYTSPNGEQLSVGPSGSGCDSTDSTLVDSSLTNPINAHAIGRRWGKLTISQTTTLPVATQIGYLWLAETSRPQYRGTLSFKTWATHPTAGRLPAWAVRAGDYVRISDHPTDIPRRIVETRYDHDSQTLSCSLDNSIFKVEAILERLGASLVGVL